MASFSLAREGGESHQFDAFLADVALSAVSTVVVFVFDESYGVYFVAGYSSAGLGFVGAGVEEGVFGVWFEVDCACDGVMLFAGEATAEVDFGLVVDDRIVHNDSVVRSRLSLVEDTRGS
jgi:hypothetical protein